MDEYAELRERDALLERVMELLYDLEDAVRSMVVECPYPRIRIDLRSIMMDLGEARTEARRKTSWFARIAPPPPRE